MSPKMGRIKKLRVDEQATIRQAVTVSKASLCQHVIEL